MTGSGGVARGPASRIGPGQWARYSAKHRVPVQGAYPGRDPDTGPQFRMSGFSSVQHRSVQHRSAPPPPRYLLAVADPVSRRVGATFVCEHSPLAVLDNSHDLFKLFPLENSTFLNCAKSVFRKISAAWGGGTGTYLSRASKQPATGR